MRARTILLVIGALIGAGALAQARVPGMVWAGGEVAVWHDYCDSLGTGDVHLFLNAADLERPTQHWTVDVRASSKTGCSASAAGRCAGSGTLAEGVKLSDCLGAVDGGAFGPVVVCSPGPARPPPMAVVSGYGHVVIDGLMGVFDGDVRALLLGTAAEDAPNICV